MLYGIPSFPLSRCMPGDLWEEALTDNPYSHVLVTTFCSGDYFRGTV